MFKLVVICGCLLAVANGGLIGGGLIGATAPGTITLQPSGIALQSGTVGVPAIASSSSNIIRGIGNLGAISAYSKSVDGPFSSERNADVRINNPDVQTGIISYAATAPALAVSGGTVLAGPLAVATAGPGLTTAYAGQGLTTSTLGLGVNGVAINGLGLGVNGYGVNGLGQVQTVNGLGQVQTVNGLGQVQTVNGLGQLQTVNGLGQLQTVNGLGQLQTVNGLGQLQTVNGLGLGLGNVRVL